MLVTATPKAQGAPWENRQKEWKRGERDGVCEMQSSRHYRAIKLLNSQ